MSRRPRGKRCCVDELRTRIEIDFLLDFPKLHERGTRLWSLYLAATYIRASSPPIWYGNELFLLSSARGPPREHSGSPCRNLVNLPEGAKAASPSTLGNTDPATFLFRKRVRADPTVGYGTESSRLIDFCDPSYEALPLHIELLIGCSGGG